MIQLTPVRKSVTSWGDIWAVKLHLVKHLKTTFRHDFPAGRQMLTPCRLGKIRNGCGIDVEFREGSRFRLCRLPVNKRNGCSTVNPKLWYFDPTLRLHFFSNYCKYRFGQRPRLCSNTAVNMFICKRAK